MIGTIKSIKFSILKNVQQQKIAIDQNQSTRLLARSLIIRVNGGPLYILFLFENL